METKKSLKASLEGNMSLGLLMGLVVGLAVIFVSFEWGTHGISVVRVEGTSGIITDNEIDITFTETPPPPPPPPVVAPVIAEILNVVEDNVELVQQEIITSEDNPNSDPIKPYVPPVEVDEEESDITIFTIVEKMPEFPGGESELLKFIASSVKYPVIAQENGVHGRVSCSFVVNRDGSIVDAVVVRSVDPSLDREALRVINSMPKWKPGEQRGKPVRVRFSIPITFRLSQK